MFYEIDRSQNSCFELFARVLVVGINLKLYRIHQRSVIKDCKAPQNR